MTRRHTSNMNGERYLGNTGKKEIHDLDMQDTKSNGCQIDGILRAGKPESPTTQHVLE